MHILWRVPHGVVYALVYYGIPRVGVCTRNVHQHLRVLALEFIELSSACCAMSATHLTSMLKTALNTNIILHIWKLVDIVPIPKRNKNIDGSTSYKPISLLSVIADIGQEYSSLHNSKHTHTHPSNTGTKTQHSTVTARDQI